MSDCLAHSLQNELMSYYQLIIDYQDFTTEVKTSEDHRSGTKVTESKKNEMWTVKYQ